MQATNCGVGVGWPKVAGSLWLTRHLNATNACYCGSRYTEGWMQRARETGANDSTDDEEIERYTV